MYLLAEIAAFAALLSVYTVSSSELTGFNLYSVEPTSDYQAKALRVLEGKNEVRSLVTNGKLASKTIFLEHQLSDCSPTRQEVIFLCPCRLGERLGQLLGQIQNQEYSCRQGSPGICG